MSTLAERKLLRPRELASQLRVNPQKILYWIHSGQLRAVNVATNPTGRPQFLIDPNDIEVFERRRAVVKAVPDA